MLWSIVVEVIMFIVVGSVIVNGLFIKLLRMCIRRERGGGGYIKIDFVIEIKLYNKILCIFVLL